MKYIKVDRCSRCPYRRPDADIAQGDWDLCIKNHRNLDYRACQKKGEFPKGCPLPSLPKVKP